MPLLDPMFKEIVDWAVEQKIDLIVPGPEVPLVEGIHDAFQKGTSIYRELILITINL